MVVQTLKRDGGQLAQCVKTEICDARREALKEGLQATQKKTDKNEFNLTGAQLRHIKNLVLKSICANNQNPLSQTLRTCANVNANLT